MLWRTAHGHISAPALPGNSRRPWQYAGLKHPTLELKRENLGLRLHFNIIVKLNEQSMISLMWVDVCICVSVSVANEVYISKREVTRGYCKSLAQNFIFRFNVFH